MSKFKVVTGERREFGMWPVSCVNPSVLQNTSLRHWRPISMERGPNS
jgi:hypothetical protein